MKKTFLTFTLLTILLSSCSRNDTENHDISTNTTHLQGKEIRILSYSKNYGYTGDEIVVTGENFPAVNQCKVYFGDTEVPVKYVSPDGKTLAFNLPSITQNNIPSLKFVFNGRPFINDVKNDYNSNIGIINKSIGKWSFATSAPKSRENSNHVVNHQLQLVSNTDDIYHKYDLNIYASLDDGISWNIWDHGGTGSMGFHAISNMNGWASSTLGLSKKDPKNPLRINSIFTNPEGVSMTTPLVYVEEDLKNGLIVSANRGVFKTNDGNNFRQIHPPRGGSLDLLAASSKLDFNHIWIGGAIKPDQKPNETFYNGMTYGTIFYCNGNNEQWKEYTFTNYPNTYVHNIHFVNQKTGFVFLYNTTKTNHKVLKSTDGGNSWNELRNIPNDISSNTTIVFINEQHGYLATNNIIYITNDGGNSWTIDYTSPSKIIDLGYRDNSVYAIIDGQIHRKFFK